MISDSYFGSSGVPMPEGSQSGDSLGNMIQSPKIDSAGEPTQRSIASPQMGREVIKTVVAANRNRSIVFSRILAKYNAERPYDAAKMEADGLGWRQNFTTKPLPSMIDKVGPRFKKVIDNLKYFTNSSLAPHWENSAMKTDKFRDGLTKLIRGHLGWNTFIEDICFDNALFGSAICACLNRYSWFPKHFKTSDESFVSDGTKAEPRFMQVIVLKENYLPNDLFEQIKDREAAKTAGWNLEQCANQINLAAPSQIRDRLNVGGTLEVWYQNAIRELTIGASYMAGVSVITVYSLLAVEVTGKVSHYRFAGPSLECIFEREDMFPATTEVVAAFTYQKGNGTIHGSKGIGRDLYELAGMVDRTRNEIVDRLIMSGKVIVQGDPKRIGSFRMNVIGSTVIFPNGWNILETKLDGDVAPFLELDQYFKTIMNELIGSVSAPPVDVGEGMRSPAAWNLLAQREEEGQDVRISRFLEQFAQLIGLLQRRICDSDVMDEDAKLFREQMLKIMSKEEFEELAACPVAGTVTDLTPAERQLIAAFAAEKKGNPMYNQRKLEEESTISILGADFAEKVLLADNDPTEKAEQSRQQEMEMMLLSAGQPVPVSPRDNHLIHLSVLMPQAEQIGGQMAQGQSGTAVLEAVVAHINEHYNQAIAQGVKPDQLAPVKDFLAKAGPAIAKLKEHDMQAAQLAQQGQNLEQNGAPPQPTPGPQSPPNQTPMNNATGNSA